MQPSSLVFVAIVAGWAAVLLPRWVARRDALGQSRGPDRDSAQMRVLDRRNPRTVAPSGPSTAPILPAKTAPAVPATTRADVPLITAGRGPGLLAPGPAASVTQGERATERTPRHSAKEHAPHLTRPQRSASPARAAATRRARVLLVLAMITLTSWAVVAIPQVPVWVAVPATGLLVTDLIVLVVSGRRRAARRRAAARSVATRITQAQRRAAAGAASPRAIDRTASRRTVVPPTVRSSSVVAEAGTPNRSTSADDVAAAAPSTPMSAEPAATAAEDGTWTPVPVPRPTYMLKPVVHRPDPRPLEESVDDPDAAAPGVTAAPAPSVETAATADPAPRPWEVEHTWADDLDVVLARRRAVNG